MSKSLGNYLLAADVLRDHDPLVVRYALAAAHYRSSLDLTTSSFEEAAAALERIRSFLERAARTLARPEDDTVVEATVPPAFAAAMDDDLNVPQALAVVHERVRQGNTALDAGEKDAARAAWADVAVSVGILGLDPEDPRWRAGGGAEAAALDALVHTMIAQRAQARAEKDWASADRIRDAIAAAGVVLEDTADGTHWSLENG